MRAVDADRKLTRLKFGSAPTIHSLGHRNSGYPHFQKSQLKLSRDSRLLNHTRARVALQIHD